MIDSLYAYNDWGNEKIFQLAEGLTDDQLDAQREMGFGSLRATMFHILAAEQVWLQRWLNHPEPSFSVDPQGMSMVAIRSTLRDLSDQRRSLIDSERSSNWTRKVDYRDLRGNQHSNRLVDLLLHVANHGIHHRAQALHFLKAHGRKVTGGIDYLFYRIAFRSTPLIPEYIEPMRQFGMEAASGEVAPAEFDKAMLQDYYRYHDWAIDQLIPLVQQLDHDSVHRPMNMGVGSMHQTLAHLRDAERWWLGIWSGSDDRIAKYNSGESLQEISASWQQLREARNAMVAAMDGQAASRVVVANLGRLKLPCRVLESMIQLCGHGTHHRAQIVNMLRQVGVRAPGVDYIVWLRSQASYGTA